MISDFVDFLENSPTIYHLIENVKEKLISNGFNEITSSSNLSSGPSRFFLIDQSNILVMNIGGNEIQNGIFFANTYRSLFKIEKHSQIPTLQHNFCRVAAKTSKINSWAGRMMRLAGNVLIQNSYSETTENVIVFPKTNCAISPPLSQLNTQFPNTIDFHLGLSRDCVPFINDYPGPIIKSISENLHISSNQIKNLDLFFVDSEASQIFGCNDKSKIIISQNISKLLSIYISLIEITKCHENECVSFMIYNSECSQDDKNLFNSKCLSIFTQLGLNQKLLNGSNLISIEPIETEVCSNSIFVDPSNSISCGENPEINKSLKTIVIQSSDEYQDIFSQVPHECTKIGYSIENLQNPREKLSFSCIQSLSFLIDLIRLQSYVNK